MRRNPNSIQSIQSPYMELGFLDIRSTGLQMATSSTPPSSKDRKQLNARKALYKNEGKRAEWKETYRQVLQTTSKSLEIFKMDEY